MGSMIKIGFLALAAGAGAVMGAEYGRRAIKQVDRLVAKIRG